MEVIAQKPKRRLNKYMTALIIVVCVTLIISATFAWFTYRANKSIDFTIGQVELNVDYCQAIKKVVNGDTTVEFVGTGQHAQTNIDDSELICNKPLISHLRIQNKENGEGVNSVDCYVRVLFEYSTNTENPSPEASSLIQDLNEFTIKTYAGKDEFGTDYKWMRLTGTNYYYLVQGVQDENGQDDVEIPKEVQEGTMMYKFVNQDKFLTFVEELRFPNVEILNHNLLLRVNYKIRVEAVQANYLVKQETISDETVISKVEGKVGELHEIMNSVFIRDHAQDSNPTS